MDAKVPLCGNFKFDKNSGQCVRNEVPVIPASCPSGYKMNTENRCISSGEVPDPDCSGYNVDPMTHFEPGPTGKYKYDNSSKTCVVDPDVPPFRPRPLPP